MKKTLFLMVVALANVTVAKADVMFLVTTRVGSDTVNWTQLGPDNTTIPNLFTATSTGGIGITGSFDGGGVGETSVEGGSWTGNFTIGDALVWTNSPGQGPLSLSLSTGVSQIGAQIQANYIGAFTAQIAAYNGATLLGSFTENGSSGNPPPEDGSAIYLGIGDATGANITKIVFSLTNAVSDPADFAVNQLSITPGGIANVPEPATWLLVGSGLALLGVARRSKSSNSD